MLHQILYTKEKILSGGEIIIEMIEKTPATITDP